MLKILINFFRPNSPLSGEMPRDEAERSFGNYFKNKGSSAEAAKSIPSTIDSRNRNFSNPRRVWWSAPSEPPSAPPIPAPDFWSTIESINTSDRPICI